MKQCNGLVKGLVLGLMLVGLFGEGPAFSYCGFDEYVKLLIRSDTYDGDTAVTDSSDSGHLITPVGDVHHSTSASKFGSTAIYFDGSGDYLSIPDSDDWYFGNGNFTVDMWVNFSVLPPYDDYAMLAQQHDGRNIWSIYWDNRIGIGRNVGLTFSGQNLDTGESWVFYQGNTDGWAINTWYHIAVVRYGNTCTLYRDGIALAIGLLDLEMPDSTSPLTIGRQTNASVGFLTGYIDEFRISKGIARWKQQIFSPPNNPYTQCADPISTVDSAQLAYHSGQIIYENTPLMIEFGGAELMATFYYDFDIANSTQLMILQDGIYQVSYSVSYECEQEPETVIANSDRRRNLRTSITKNQSTEISSSVAYGYARGYPDYGETPGVSQAPFATNTAIFFTKLEANDTIELLCQPVGNWQAGFVSTIEDETSLSIKLIEVITP